MICLRTHSSPQGKHANWGSERAHLTSRRKDTLFLVATEIPNSKGLQRLFRENLPLNIYSEQPETFTYYRLKSKSKYFWGYLKAISWPSLSPSLHLL
jgi:hypothetical protein